MCSRWQPGHCPAWVVKLKFLWVGIRAASRTSLGAYVAVLFHDRSCSAAFVRVYVRMHRFRLGIVSAESAHNSLSVYFCEYLTCGEAFRKRLLHGQLRHDL